MKTEGFPEGPGSIVVAGMALDSPGLGPLVERGRLSSRLRSVDTPLVLLHAPAGYGKSVLLAQWARLDPRPFASFTLTAAHNDPAVLLASLVEALEPIEPLPGSIITTIESPEPNLDLVLPRLETALGTRTVDAVLVIDELEHLRSDLSLRVLEAIINSVSDPLHLAMATRRTPQIHVARLQAARRLTLLGSEDLAMTAGEARRLLAGSGLEASDDELEAIVTKAEGWPVALYLAALARRPSPGQSLPEEGFGGEERNLVDYMREELLAGAPAEDVDFMVRTSLLDRLSGDLCDAVLGQAGSGARLAELSRRNLLLIPLDRRDEWFRMHSLLAEMLRAELRHRHGDEVQELSRRASLWWEEAGDPPHAIGFAIDAPDFTRAGRLIWEAVPAFNSTGRYASVQHWIEKIGLERAGLDPHLALTVAHGALAAGDGGAAEYWAGVARPMLEAGHPMAPDLPAALAMIDATLARGGTAAMAAAAERATNSLATDSPWTSMADLMAGLAEHFDGEIGAARERLTDSARRAAVWKIPLIQVLALAQLALLSIAEGDHQTARILASQARAQISRSGLIARPSIGLAVAVSAYVNATERRRREALVDLAIGRSLLAQLRGFGSWFEIETAAALGSAAVCLNDAGAAQQLLQIARRRLEDLPDAPMLDAWVDEIGSNVSSLPTDRLAELTPAELRILALLSSHLSYPQIATRLSVSPNTVKTQVRAVFAKLDVSSRDAAVKLGRELGFSPEQAGSAPREAESFAPWPRV